MTVCINYFMNVVPNIARWVKFKLYLHCQGIINAYLWAREKSRHKVISKALLQLWCRP